MPRKTTNPVHVYTSVNLPADMASIADYALDMSTYTSKSALIRDVLLYFCASLRRNDRMLSEDVSREAGERLRGAFGGSWREGTVEAVTSVMDEAGPTETQRALIRQVVAGDAEVAPRDVRAVWAWLPLDVRMRIAGGES